MALFRQTKMDFYLVRHGDAKPESEDPRRPLSRRGEEEVAKVARTAAARGISVFEVLHSDKLRAKQTAEILARSLSPEGGIREIGGLSPQDDPWLAKAELEAAGKALMLVGHLPHLGRLASLLVAGDPEREIVTFPSGALACLSRAEGRWELKWTVTPETA